MLNVTSLSHAMRYIAQQNHTQSSNALQTANPYLESDTMRTTYNTKPQYSNGVEPTTIPMFSTNESLLHHIYLQYRANTRSPAPSLSSSPSNPASRAPADLEDIIFLYRSIYPYHPITPQLLSLLKSWIPGPDGPSLAYENLMRRFAEIRGAVPFGGYVPVALARTLGLVMARRRRDPWREMGEVPTECSELGLQDIEGEWVGGAGEDGWFMARRDDDTRGDRGAKAYGSVQEWCCGVPDEDFGADCEAIYGFTAGEEGRLAIKDLSEYQDEWLEGEVVEMRVVEEWARPRQVEGALFEAVESAVQGSFAFALAKVHVGQDEEEDESDEVLSWDENDPDWVLTHNLGDIDSDDESFLSTNGTSVTGDRGMEDAEAQETYRGEIEHDVNADDTKDNNSSTTPSRSQCSHAAAPTTSPSTAQTSEEDFDDATPSKSDSKLHCEKCNPDPDFPTGPSTITIPSSSTPWQLQGFIPTATYTPSGTIQQHTAFLPRNTLTPSQHARCQTENLGFATTISLHFGHSDLAFLARKAHPDYFPNNKTFSNLPLHNTLEQNTLHDTLQRTFLARDDLLPHDLRVYQDTLSRRVSGRYQYVDPERELQLEDIHREVLAWEMGEKTLVYGVKPELFIAGYEDVPAEGLTRVEIPRPKVEKKKLLKEGPGAVLRVCRVDCHEPVVRDDGLSSEEADEMVFPECKEGSEAVRDLLEYQDEWLPGEESRMLECVPAWARPKYRGMETQQIGSEPVEPASWIPSEEALHRAWVLDVREAHERKKNVDLAARFAMVAGDAAKVARGMEATRARKAIVGLQVVETVKKMQEQREKKKLAIELARPYRTSGLVPLQASMSGSTSQASASGSTSSTNSARTSQTEESHGPLSESEVSSYMDSLPLPVREHFEVVSWHGAQEQLPEEDLVKSLETIRCCMRLGWGQTLAVLCAEAEQYWWEEGDGDEEA